MFRSAFLIAALMAAMAVPALAPRGAGAAAPSPRKLTSPAEQARWPAVGRLNIAGRGFCTATLIAPDLVLTAAHCMFNPLTRVATNPRSMVFVAGYRMGGYVALRRGARVAVSRRYDPGGRPGDNLPLDLAVVELAEPIPAALIRPLKTGCCAVAGDPAQVVSYGMDRPEALSRQTGCAVYQRVRAILSTTCEATPGVSGAPLLRAGGGAGGGEVIGVISAMGGRVRGAALAAAIDELLPILRARLR